MSASKATLKSETSGYTMSAGPTAGVLEEAAEATAARMMNYSVFILNYFS